MPPVRWKFITQVTLLIIFIRISKSDPQDRGSIDGWRPIIGKSQREAEDAITIYRNPSQKDSESIPVKAETLSYRTQSPPLSTKPYQTISTSEAIAAALTSSNNKLGKKIHGSKVTPVLKLQQPIVLIPKFNTHSHGPHIPLSSSNQKGSQRRHPVINSNNNHKGKRPVNAIRGSSSLKNEIYLPASATSSGSFAIFNQPIGPHRVRENQNLAAGKHFHLIQNQYANHFGLTNNQGNNDIVIQQVPVRTILIQNQHSNQNEQNAYLKSDDFTKNLVPPPYSYIQQNNAKPTEGPQHDHAEYAEKNTYHHAKLVGNKFKDRRVAHPENGISHTPSHYEEKNKFHYHGGNANDDTDVQVTKEKIKTLHNSIPLSFHSDEEENDPYQFQHNRKPNENVRSHVAESYSSINNYNHDPSHKNKLHKNPTRDSYIVYEDSKDDRYRKPSIAPNNPTYEVTEGKQWQVFQPFLSTRPTVQYKPIYSQLAPSVQQAEPVENTFLPTPYHPENAIPTSVAQDDISSIYTELNNKKKIHQHQEYVSEQPDSFFNFREEENLNHFKPHQEEELNRYNPHQDKEINNFRPHQEDKYVTEQPDYFNIREVSTHYPVVGKSEYPTVEAMQDGAQSTEYTNEVTTLRSNLEKYRPLQNYQSEEDVNPPTINPTKPPVTRKPQDHRSRKPNRRRKPQANRSTTASTTASTSTEQVSTEATSYNVHKVEHDNKSNDTPKTKRVRKPSRVRTTQTPIVEVTTRYYDYTTKFSQATKQKSKNKLQNVPIKSSENLDSGEESQFSLEESEEGAYSERITPIVHNYQDTVISDDSHRYQSTTQDYSNTDDSELINPKVKPTENAVDTEDYFKVISTNRYEPVETEDINSKYIVEHPQVYTENYAIQEKPSPKRKRIRPKTTSTSTTTEAQQTIYTLIPENEVDFDYSTHSNQFESAKEYTSTQEVPTKSYSNHKIRPSILTTIISTPPPPTTTIATTTSTETTTKLNRVRGRPTSKYDNKNRPRFSVKEYRDRLNQYSSTSSTESSKVSTESNRIRFPNRSRKTSTTAQDEDSTTEKTKFTPKEPRYNSDTTPIEKKISTRVRVLNNRRSTTEASTTLRVSIKPNIFSNLKRPTPLTLKTRIFNKNNRNNTEEKVTEKPTTIEVNEEDTPPADLATEPSIKQISLSEKHDVDIISDDDDELEENENDVLLLSQRISNLTSSAQNEYDTPGLFKAVSPNSRIVPSYFTISTDDPILPIEAFFPSIKEKISRNDDN